MSEIFLPTTLERLKVCDDEIRSIGRKVDNEKNEDAAALEIQGRAEIAVAQIVPEIQQWRGAQLEVATDLARYAMSQAAVHDREVRDDLFLLSGLFKKSGLQKVIEPDDDGIAMSSYQLCLKFLPEIRSDQSDLVIAESVLVPVSSLEMIDQL